MMITLDSSHHVIIRRRARGAGGALPPSSLMISLLLGRVLRLVLGWFVELDAETCLELSFWSGVLEVRNARLRADLLRRFGLPLAVSQGRIGRLAAHIPWRQLRQLPVTVELHDVEIVVERCAPPPITPQALAAASKRRARQRQQQQQDAESGAVLATPEAPPAADGWLRIPFKTIARNARVDVHNLCVSQLVPVATVDDASSPSSSPPPTPARAALGVRITQLSVEPRDASGAGASPAPFVQWDASVAAHEGVTLRGLVVFSLQSAAAPSLDQGSSAEEQARAHTATPTARDALVHIIGPLHLNAHAEFESAIMTARGAGGAGGGVGAIGHGNHGRLCTKVQLFGDGVWPARGGSGAPARGLRTGRGHERLVAIQLCALSMSAVHGMTAELRHLTHALRCAREVSVWQGATRVRACRVHRTL